MRKYLKGFLLKYQQCLFYVAFLSAFTSNLCEEVGFDFYRLSVYFVLKCIVLAQLIS